VQQQKQCVHVSQILQLSGMDRLLHNAGL